jgi:hypothetical protein
MAGPCDVPRRESKVLRSTLVFLVGNSLAQLFVGNMIWNLQTLFQRLMLLGAISISLPVLIIADVYVYTLERATNLRRPTSSIICFCASVITICLFVVGLCLLCGSDLPSVFSSNVPPLFVLSVEISICPLSLSRALIEVCFSLIAIAGSLFLLLCQFVVEWPKATCTAILLSMAFSQNSQ